MPLIRFAKLVGALCFTFVVVVATVRLAATAQVAASHTGPQIAAQSGQSGTGTPPNSNKNGTTTGNGATGTTTTGSSGATGTTTTGSGDTTVTTTTDAGHTTGAAPSWWLTNNFLAMVIWVSSLIAVGAGLFLYVRSQPPQAPGPREITDRDLESYRISYGFWLIVAGLMLTLAVVIITVTFFNTQAHQFSDVIAVITSVTGVVGTLTAAFFGVQAAGAGRSQAMSALSDQVKSQGSGAGATAYKIEPPVGPHSGNTSISISGNGLTGATGVNFGTLQGLNFAAVNDGLVKVTSPVVPLDKDHPEKTKSDYELSVVYASTAQNNRVAGTFYYYTMEVVTDLDGVQEFNLYGAGLNGATAIQIGDEPPVLVEGKDPNKIQIKLPKALFAVDVEVAVIYSPDSPNKRFVVGRFTFPPTPATKKTSSDDGNGGGDGNGSNTNGGGPGSSSSSSSATLNPTVDGGSSSSGNA